MQKKDYISFQNKFDKIKWILGMIISIISIFTYFDDFKPVGFAFIFISLFLFISEGIDINLNSKKYRQFLCIFKYKFGKWRQLENIKYASVFETSVKNKMEIGIVSFEPVRDDWKNTVFRVQIFFEDGNKLFIIDLKNKSKAFKIAFKIAKKLNVKVLDATKG